MSGDDSGIDNVSGEIDNDGYECSVGETAIEVEETMLKEIKKIKKNTKKTQNMVELLMDESNPTLSARRSSSSESPRPILLSPRGINQDTDKMLVDVINKMSSDIIVLLKKTNEELALQRASIENLSEQLQFLLIKNKKN